MSILQIPRRGLTGDAGGGDLPLDYQQVTHIVNGYQDGINYGGRAFLDLDISVTDDDIIECEIRTVNGESDVPAGLFGGRSSATQNNLILQVNETGHATLDYGNYRDNRVDVNSSLPQTLGNFKSIVLDKSGIIIGSTTYALAPTASFATPNFYLFNAYNGWNMHPKGMQVRRFEIKDKCNLVPCYRKADGVIGMYDTIRQRFFVNAGSTAFGKGADI